MLYAASLGDDSYRIFHEAVITISNIWSSTNNLCPMITNGFKLLLHQCTEISGCLVNKMLHVYGCFIDVSIKCYMYMVVSLMSLHSVTWKSPILPLGLQKLVFIFLTHTQKEVFHNMVSLPVQEYRLNQKLSLALWVRWPLSLPRKVVDLGHTSTLQINNVTVGTWMKTFVMINLNM